MVAAAAITAVKLLAGAVVIAVTGASGAGIAYAVHKRNKTGHCSRVKAFKPNARGNI